MAETFWTLPNAITLSAHRADAVPVRAALVRRARVERGHGHRVPGRLAHRSARRLPGAPPRHQESRIGKLLDPLADKLLVMTAFVMLVGVGRVPRWALPLVIAILGARDRGDGAARDRGLAGRRDRGVEPRASGRPASRSPRSRRSSSTVRSSGLPAHEIGLLLLVIVATVLTVWSRATQYLARLPRQRRPPLTARGAGLHKVAGSSTSSSVGRAPRCQRGSRRFESGLVLHPFRGRPVSLSHLQALEAETIHIIREVAAEFRNPVMLYSIGKDSAVLAHLARKAFHPGRVPFPLLHVDTTWKFRDMYAFRERFARENGFELLVARNPEGKAKNVNPFDYGSNVYTNDHEDPGAAPGAREVRLRRGLRRRAPRRGEVARQGARVLVPRPQPPVGSEEPAPRAVEPVQRRGSTRASRSACSRSRTGPSSTSGCTSTARASRWCRSTSPAQRPIVERDGNLIMVDDERMRLRPGEKPRAAHGPLPHARLLPALGRDRVRRRRRCPRSSARCCSRASRSARAA